MPGEPRPQQKQIDRQQLAKRLEHYAQDVEAEYLSAQADSRISSDGDAGYLKRLRQDLLDARKIILAEPRA